MDSIKKNLFKIYREDLLKYSFEERNHAVTVVDDVVVINFDSIYLRECGLRGVDQVLYLAHKFGINKRFLFLSEDGAIIKNSGALQVIENIINCFDLNADTCAVICREDIKIPNATVINNNFCLYWCDTIYTTLKAIEIQQGKLSKKFAVWFNRGTFYRLQLTQHLHDNHRNDSFISYQQKGMLHEGKLGEYFEEPLLWANINTPIIYDKLFDNGEYDYELIVGGGRKPYSSYFMEIVAETNIIDNGWITEKTIKNLYIGKPFIMYSGPNSLKLLKDQGFQTFDKWFDESYDSIENSYLRLEAIKKEIDRIAQLSYEELTKMQEQMLPVFEHNRKTFLKFVPPWKY